MDVIVTITGTYFDQMLLDSIRMKNKEGLLFILIEKFYLTKVMKELCNVYNKLMKFDLN